MRILTFFVLAIGLLWSPLVFAESAPLASLPGEWRQIDSNAGHCADCRIVVESGQTGFTVVSNNGWSAVVQARPEGPIAAGLGSWKPNHGGSYSGKDFVVSLALFRGKLLMLMTVLGPTGNSQNIKATFEKSAAAGTGI